jgi:hypothetical protein
MRRVSRRLAVFRGRDSPSGLPRQVRRAFRRGGAGAGNVPVERPRERSARSAERGRGWKRSLRGDRGQRRVVAKERDAAPGAAGIGRPAPPWRRAHPAPAGPALTIRVARRSNHRDRRARAALLPFPRVASGDVEAALSSGADHGTGAEGAGRCRNRFCPHRGRGTATNEARPMPGSGDEGERCAGRSPGAAPVSEADADAGADVEADPDFRAPTGVRRLPLQPRAGAREDVLARPPSCTPGHGFRSHSTPRRCRRTLSSPTTTRRRPGQVPHRGIAGTPIARSGGRAEPP